MSSNNSPLYRKIYELYKEQILTGQLPVGYKLPTEAEIAKQFGVSRTTAKRAMDDLEHDGYIERRWGSGSYVNSTDTMIAAVQCNTRHVGFVLPCSIQSESNFLTMLKGANELLMHHGCQMVLYSCDLNEKSEQQALLKARADGCDGILYYPGPLEIERDILLHMAAARYPLVVLDKVLDSIPLTYVVSDNVGGSFALAKHMLDKGHKTIAFLKPMGFGDTTGERYIGCCRAISEAGLPPEALVLQDIFEKKEDLINSFSCFNDAAVERLVEIIPELRSKQVTAICALNDNLAILVYHAMKRLGLSIPEDMAVGGFDDLDYAQLVVPALTTVKQDFYRIGNVAAQKLYGLLQNPSAAPDRTVIPTVLVQRDSI